MVFLVFLFAGSVRAGIPLSAEPVWTSTDNDYSTGGALFDMTGDGWVDFCTGNGNDMGSNTNALYLNNGGTLETVASWRSQETGYFSHIYIGDCNNDGKLDMAVSYLGYGSDNQGAARIYFNTGTGLGSTATWTSTDEYNSFDCALGDVDLDGDLDLAVAAGDAYSNLGSPVRVYRNNGGIFETTPFWTSLDSAPSDACRWVDLDNDGFLDLVVGYRRKLAVFKNSNGILERTASWTTNRPGWILRIAVGDYNRDGFKDIAVASNGQLSGDASQVEVFRNFGGSLETHPAFTLLGGTDYCSCVEWGDPNGDGWLDLAAGGWWEPLSVFENKSGVIDTTPAWSWDGGFNLVSEMIMWNDVRNKFLSTVSEYKSGDGARKLFYCEHQPIQSFEGVKVDGSAVPLSDFSYDPLTGWVSLKHVPAKGDDNVEIRYSYSQHPDLGVTNWVNNAGNHLFSNTSTAVEEKTVVVCPAPRLLQVYPNPARGQVRIQITLPEEAVAARRLRLNIFDVVGTIVKSFSLPMNRGPQYIFWNCCNEQGQRLPAGIYFATLAGGRKTAQEKFIIVR